MPVSHLGLTVSHLPSATSFYLAALHPLGYHYIGQRGDSIGLGVVEADFYLTQDTRGHVPHSGPYYSTHGLTPRPSRLRRAPTHIAFCADNRLAVRNCYAAALTAGAKPSGAPGYTDPDAIAFNAAVEDLDGNTLEIIFREPTSFDESLPPEVQVPESTSVSRYDASHADHKSMASGVSRAKSRARTAMDIVSATSAARRQSDTPTKSQAPPPSQGISRSVTSPAVAPSSYFPHKKVFGTILGAAAGAAFAYAMTHAEAESARDERDFIASTRDKSPGRRSQVRSRREASEPPRSTHRRHNYSVTESAPSVHAPPSTMKTIEAGRHDDDEVQQTIRRYRAISQPPQPRESRTLGTIEFVPARPYTSRDSRYTLKRSSTLPVDTPKHSLDASKPHSSVSRSSRHSARRPSHRDHDHERHDSVVNLPSHHSPPSRAPTSSSRHQSETSTVKPWPASGHHAAAADIPLPSSRAASSYHTSAKVHSQPSYVSTARIPLPQSRTNDFEDADDSDGIGDCNTVVPDDSISCVGFKERPRHHRSSTHHSSGKHSSRRSEADGGRTTRQVRVGAGDRYSAITLPVRVREHPSSPERGRKTYSHV